MSSDPQQAGASKPRVRKRIVMIGAPVTAVRTPPLLEAWLAQQGIAADVETRHVEPDDLDAFMRSARNDDGLDGLMVTMPHKKTVIPHLTAISDTAIAAGSVNAVKRLAGKEPAGGLVGAQFDGMALVHALRARDISLASARILLAGVGGAGLAIAQAIAAHGCESLTLVDRNRLLLNRVVQSLHDAGGCGAVGIGGSDAAAYDLLINATPLGMQPDDPCPFDETLVARTGCIADIVADPPNTRLAALARDSGATFVSGRDMVMGQIPVIGAWLLQDGLQQAACHDERG